MAEESANTRCRWSSRSSSDAGNLLNIFKKACSSKKIREARLKLGLGKRGNLSGEGATYMGQEPLGSTLDKTVR